MTEFSENSLLVLENWRCVLPLESTHRISSRTSQSVLTRAVGTFNLYSSRNSLQVYTLLKTKLLKGSWHTKNEALPFKISKSITRTSLSYDLERCPQTLTSLLQSQQVAACTMKPGASLLPHNYTSHLQRLCSKFTPVLWNLTELSLTSIQLLSTL